MAASQLDRAIQYAARRKYAGDGVYNNGISPTQLKFTHSGAGMGALAGLVGGGLWGAYDPGSRPVLDAKGKPTLVRRNRILSAIQTAIRGGSLGALGGGVAGNMIGGVVAGPQEKFTDHVTPGPVTTNRTQTT